MTLEEQLREAAAKGLVHLTLHTVWSEDRKTVYWAARATPSTGHSYVQAQGLDPVEIVQEVLKVLPKAPKRMAPPPARAELPFTAAVIADEPLEADRPVASPATINPSEIDQWLPKT